MSKHEFRISLISMPVYFESGPIKITSSAHDNNMVRQWKKAHLSTVDYRDPNEVISLVM